MQTKRSLDYLEKIYNNMGEKQLDERMENTLERLSSTDWGIRHYLEIFIKRLQEKGRSKARILATIDMLDIIDRT